MTIPWLILLFYHQSLGATRIFLSGSAKIFLARDLRDAFVVCQEGNRDTTIKQIELYNEKDKSTHIYPLNPQGNRHLRIITEIFLTTPSFNALFSCASFMAGVSGDNTFELAVAHKKLPFYWSTNSGLKRGTIEGLQQIIEDHSDEMTIAEETKKDLLTFFNYENLENFTNYHWRYLNPLVSQFKNINLFSMAEAWHKIAEYITKNYNFLDRLQGVFLEDLHQDPSVASDVATDDKISMLGTYPYHQISHWHIDDTEKSDPIEIVNSDHEKTCI